jgi:hypothetical protein
MILTCQMRLVLQQYGQETHDEPRVVPHLPLVSTHDRNISNKLDVDHHRCGVHR